MLTINRDCVPRAATEAANGSGIFDMTKSSLEWLSVKQKLPMHGSAHQTFLKETPNDELPEARNMD